MNDLLIVFIGLSIILYIFFVLGTSRTAIKKGFNGVLWLLFSIVLPPFSFITVLLVNPKDDKTDNGINFFNREMLVYTFRD